MVLCVSVFFENLVTSGVATVILSTLEKEFFLTSTQSGFFLSVFELAAFVASPIFGFLGNKLNKMRLISTSLLLVTIGSFVIGSSIFFKSPDPWSHQDLSIGSNGSSLICRSNAEGLGRECDLVKEVREESSFSYKMPNLQYLLYFGHIIIGFGSVALYTIGIAYIEEISPPQHSSYCQAIFYGLGMLCLKKLF